MQMYETMHHFFKYLPRTTTYLEVNLYAKRAVSARDVALAEPGFNRLVSIRRRAGTSESPLRTYASVLGAVRPRAPRALLDLSMTEIEALGERFVGRAPIYRIAMKMFYKANRRYEVAAEPPSMVRSASACSSRGIS